MTIRRRLLLVLAFVGAGNMLACAIQVGIGLQQRHRFDMTARSSQSIAGEWLPLGEAVRALLVDAMQMRRFIADAAATPQADSLEAAASAAASFQSDAERSRSMLRRLAADGVSEASPLLDRLAEIEPAFNAYRDLAVAVARAPTEPGGEPASGARQRLDPPAEQLSGRLAALLADVSRRVDAASADVARETHAGSALAARSVAIASGLLLIGLVACGVAAVLVRRGVTEPLTRLQRAIDALASGSAPADIPGIKRADEIGRIAAAVQVFQQRMMLAAGVAGEREREREAREQQAQRLETLVRRFEADAGAAIDLLGSASSEMEATARSMLATAVRTDQQAGSVAQAAEETSAGVGTAAAAAEQLTALIGEISRQMAHSSDITGRRWPMPGAPTRAFGRWPRPRSGWATSSD